ncbi:unnamed protein product [Aspergillus oryzae RIB40]|uniref:DNA, SC026 n=1 Tax=Aspergillus oryzae (strain ATCC 42149 / RIB 40) TaxID=510516 RepID=Q2UF46_ASPOR|nr:unnamed protein product [Aspergillus oryzae RIB40]BAE59819.1 unnamed protein product [Aspergillus oryzae RIB40]
MLLADVPQSSMLQQYLVDGMILGALIHIGDLFTKSPEYQERMSTRHILKITSQTALEMKETVVQNGETLIHKSRFFTRSKRDDSKIIFSYLVGLLQKIVEDVEIREPKSKIIHQGADY